ncbi:MAG: UDP-N-acetylmuramoyl-L-alanyl-D-glutamate--2,6-diaminopimelate ligase [Fidelibacterota bacterium]
MEKLTSILNGVDLISEIPLDVPIQSICADSRRVWPGSLFVAIHGTQQDGTKFIPEALAKGAAAVISNGKDTDKEVKSNTPLIRVQNPRLALSQMAANYYDNPSAEMTLVGVTGTNGKTTTCHILYDILKAYGLKTGIMGTLGAKSHGMEATTSLTTPDSLELHRMLRLFCDGGVTHVIMEVSSHALELERVHHVQFDYAVFTNLSQDHLDFHKTMNNYFQAKTKLFSMINSEGKAIINYDDERAENLSEFCSSPILSCSLAGNTDVHFVEWGMSRKGITGIIALGKDRITVSSALLGVHNLENILSAAATAWSMGIPREAIEAGISQCQNIPGRMEQFSTKNGATVIVDYAHTPDAYEKLFSSLKTLLPAGGKLWVIFGCGGDRDHEKRPMMAAKAESFADHILVVPDNPRTESLEEINREIEAGFTQNKHEFRGNRGKAIREIIGKLSASDILAVVGKGQDNYDIIGRKRITYSDIDTVLKAINEN